MQFGIFDQNDRGPSPLAEQYENRLKLIEFYDRAGFRAYHMSEHHATPLNLTPSPSVFLAAAAQRTRRLRLGALVYILPAHHPLRLAEEICMLDHLSGGRLEVGVGRGASPHELHYFGIDPDAAPAMYVEAYTVIRQALTQPEVNFNGKYYNFENVPIEMKSLQRPHPPFWYAVPVPDGAAWPAQNEDQYRLRRTGDKSPRDYRSLPRRMGGGREIRRMISRCSASTASSLPPIPTARRWRSAAAPGRCFMQAS